MNDLAVGNLVDMFQESAGAGFEGMTANDMSIPYLTILQSASPQCKKSDSRYVKGAEEGVIYNTLTQELATEVCVIPCVYEHVLQEWKPRSSGGGGGFVGSGPFSQARLDACRRDDKGKFILDNGNTLEDTMRYYVLVLDPVNQVINRAIISMASTQLKIARRWNSLMASTQLKNAKGQAFVPPMYASIYLMTTVGDSNTKGSWFSWAPIRVSMVDAEQFVKAKEFVASIRSGEVKAPALEAHDDIPF